MSDWNADIYLKFKEERTQPSKDLVAKIPIQSPNRIIDIGCGPGNSTAVLGNRYNDAYILGVDNSSEMIDKAKKSYPNFDFKKLDAAVDIGKAGTDFDIVFSNACLQWLPDHKLIIMSWAKLLKKGGALAIQMPFNEDEPIKRIIERCAKLPEFRKKLFGARPKNVLAIKKYYEVLSREFREVNIWETAYYHVMQDSNSILEWYKGTGLRPYLAKLDEGEQEKFLSKVYDLIKVYYPEQTDSKVLFKFPRVFFVAKK